MTQLIPVKASAILADLKGSHPPGAHWVFDCDGTIVTGDICTHANWVLMRHGLCNQEVLPEWALKLCNSSLTYEKYGEIKADIEKNHLVEFGLADIHYWEYHLQVGLSPKLVSEAAEEALQRGLDMGTLKFTQPITQLLKGVAGDAWIVSGSPHATVTAIAHEVGVPSGRVLATKLETVDGIFRPRFEEPGIIWAITKRTTLEDHLVNRPWFVAGDTTGDWEMLQMATNWAWCVVWGRHRYRGVEFSNFLQEHLLRSTPMPTEPGIYIFASTAPQKRWIIEVKGP